MERPVGNNLYGGASGAVIQAGTVGGGIHFHPPAAATTVLPRSLPAAPRWLVGREREMARLDTLLAPDAPHRASVMVIEGAAGVGKTTLALHWLHQHAEHHRDGQLYADLRGFDPRSAPRSPTAVAHDFLLALGVSPGAIPANREARLGLCRSLLANRRSAILLDNALDTNQVEPLLPGTSSCTVIVTTRNHLSGLHARGAPTTRLDVLGRSSARDLLTRYLGAHLVDQEPAAVGEVLEWCGGLPLALAIVAARSATHPSFPLSALVHEFQEAAEGLEVFDGGEDTTNLRTVLSTSYRALEGSVASLFRLMGLIPTTETALPALASLAGLPTRTTAALLADLERKNLAQQHRPRRFQMHGLVRRYAGYVAEQFDDESRRLEAVRRLIDHYAWTATVADRILYANRAEVAWTSPVPGCQVEEFSGESEALDWFAAEQQNVLAAQQQAAELGWHERVWQLARAMDTFHYRCGYLPENIASATLGLRAAETLSDRDRAMAYRQLGRAYFRAGDLRASEDKLAVALELNQRAEDWLNQAHTLHDLARIWAARGNQLRALRHSSAALRLYREVGNEVGEAHALNAMGRYHAELGHFARARSYCDKALASHERLGNLSGAVATLDNLGLIALRSGRVRAAVSLLESALGVCAQLRNTFFQATVTENLAQAHLVSGNRVKAREMWQAAHDLYTRQHRIVDAERVRARLAVAES